MTAAMQSKDPQTYAIIGAAMEVHRELGCGFLENVYHQAMQLEMATRSIPFTSEIEVLIAYKGVVLPCGYRADFVCYGEIIVEIKAIKTLSGIERSQVINYLRATKFKRALLINFGTESLEYERIVN